MALANRDRVLEKSTTTGTGTYTLGGTPGITGFNTNDYGLFSLVGDGNTVQYSAWGVDPTTGIPNNTGWETGLGTYTSAGTTLARTTVYASTNANAAVDWAAGTRFVACTPMTQGTLTVRQPGGTAGTDELQLSCDGTDSFLENKAGGNLKVNSATCLVNADGDLYLSGYDASYFRFRVGDFVLQPYGNSNGFVANNAYFDGATYQRIVDGYAAAFQFYNGQFMVFCENTGSGSFSQVRQFKVDYTGLVAIGGSIPATPGDSSGCYVDINGTSGLMRALNWFQNTAGEARLNADYTKNNATLANTNLSLTLIAGRSYRFQGYLIVSNSTAGEGAKFDFDGGTATMTEIDIAFNAVAATAPVAGTIVSTALATDLNYTTVTGTARIFVSGSCQVNAGGTFILRASEDTTATGTMTLGKGSWLAFYDTVDL